MNVSIVHSTSEEPQNDDGGQLENTPRLQLEIADGRSQKLTDDRGHTSLATVRTPQVFPNEGKLATKIPPHGST